jgi:hypothetical protein
VATLHPLIVGAKTARYWDGNDFLREAGIPNYSGMVSLVYAYQGLPSDVIMASGIIDQSKTYAFQSETQPVGRSQAKTLKGWNVAEGNDTMISLLNPTQKDEDLLLTLFHEAGQYKIPVHLTAGASTMFDAADLIAMQEPDADGHTISPYILHGTAVLSAASGGAEVINVAAEVGVFNVTNAACGDMCPNCLGYSGGYRVQNDSGPVAVGQTASFSAWALRQDGVWVNVSCNHPSEEASTLWTSSNNSVAQPSSCGNFTTNSPGTFTATAESTLIDWPADCPGGRGHLCPTNNFGPAGAGGTAKPTISGPNTVWWFNGQNPAGYATSVTLTSSGGNGTTWGIAAGADKITLSPTGNTASVTSTGSAFSSAIGDIQITAQVNFVTSDPFFMTTHTPNELVKGTITHNCDATWGYRDLIQYTILDQLTIPLPTSVTLSEEWTTLPVPDFSGTNWRRGDPGGTTTDPATPSQFLDSITGENVSNPTVFNPVPTPVCSGNGTSVQHWGQAWRVGSTLPGIGRRVQTNTLQKYIDHANSTGITTPAP